MCVIFILNVAQISGSLNEKTTLDFLDIYSTTLSFKAFLQKKKITQKYFPFGLWQFPYPRRSFLIPRCSPKRKSVIKSFSQKVPCAWLLFQTLHKSQGLLTKNQHLTSQTFIPRYFLLGPSHKKRKKLRDILLLASISSIYWKFFLHSSTFFYVISFAEICDKIFFAKISMCVVAILDVAQISGSLKEKSILDF